ncbi:MAG: helix-turn-helix transcriptional regulator [Clostridiales bacterium]|nr:helix-turn-helix transcriptional regulator [Clostridiales bacterium]
MDKKFENRKFYDSKLLGSIIKVNRLLQNMSQTSLVEGICVPSYLSRIENAEIIPSIEVVNEIFKALNLEYFDDPEFILENKQLFDDYIHALLEGELGLASELYETINRDEKKLMCSPIIIEFLLVKYLRLVDSEQRDEIAAVDRLLVSILDYMDTDQLHIYMLYKGIDLRDVDREFKTAETCFKKAETEKITGKVHHELAKLYFEWGNMILALDYINKAQNLYSEEGNIMGLIAVNMIKGQIFVYENQYATGIKYLTKCAKLFRRIKEPTYETYIYNHLAWAYILDGQLDRGQKVLAKCSKESILLKQISKDLIDPLSKGENPFWYDNLEVIENRLEAQQQTGRYHKLEEKYLELRRNQLYRSMRKYKKIDDYRVEKLQVE